MAQGFFEATKDRCLVACLEKDHPVFCQTGLRQGRCKQVGLAITPQDLPARTRSNAGGERSGCGAIYRSIGAAGNLVKSAQGKPAFWEAPVDLGNAERKHDPGTAGDATDPFDLIAKLSDACSTLL